MSYLSVLGFFLPPHDILAWDGGGWTVNRLFVFQIRLGNSKTFLCGISRPIKGLVRDLRQRYPTFLALGKVLWKTIFPWKRGEGDTSDSCPSLNQAWWPLTGMIVTNHCSLEFLNEI